MQDAKHLRKIVAEKKGMMENSRWICHCCGRILPRTMLYCPKCNIARKHSQNLWRDQPEEGKIK